MKELMYECMYDITKKNFVFERTSTQKFDFLSSEV